MAEDPTKGRRQELYGGITPYTIPVLQTLTKATADLNKIVPQLATEWETTSDTTWEFTLREDVTFHNGVDLTAQTAAESLTGLLEERGAIGWADLDKDSFSASDEYTLEIETTSPSPFLPGNLAHPVMALHYRGDEGGKGPIGTGPFMTGKVEQGEPITTTVYDDYWGNQPYFDELTFKGIPDDTTRTSSLKSAEVDVGLDLPPQEFKGLQKAENVTVRTQEQPRTVMTPINIYKSPTDDAKLRLALNYAVDQQAIVENIVAGVGTPARGPFAPVIKWSVHDALPSYGPDMDQARQLVKESSYDGEKVSLILASGSPTRKQIAEYMQEEFSKINVNLSLRVMEPASYWEKFRNGESNLILGSLGSYSGATDYLIPGLFHSEDFINGKLYEKNGTGIMNLGEDLDQQIETATQTWDEKARHKMYAKIQERVMEEAVLIPLYYKNYMLGTQTDITGPEFHAIPRMIDWLTMSRE